MTLHNLKRRMHRLRQLDVSPTETTLPTPFPTHSNFVLEAGSAVSGGGTNDQVPIAAVGRSSNTSVRSGIVVGISVGVVLVLLVVVIAALRRRRPRRAAGGGYSATEKSSGKHDFETKGMEHKSTKNNDVDNIDYVPVLTKNGGFTGARFNVALAAPSLPPPAYVQA
ncbi:hypothetical protein NM688_g6298 [Phlebia brevispora]|uniref:Uncharacterized protein n=1 Tax=Phlebia brevispora TaxID=194682 RepID=A0ACC1SHJ4_9APHY|nr:hypothetical protein NM688_g6298 [Phlebia brevispora]